MDGPQFLQALLDLRGLNPNAMAKKAGNHALQSTVARFLGGNQSRRSTMQPVADFFGVDVGGFYDPDKAIMELARIGGAARTLPATINAASLAHATAPGAPVVTLAQALEVVAASLNQLPDERRELAAQRLQTLARAPDSARAMESLLAAMRPTPSPPPPESRDFQPPVPSGLFVKHKHPS